MSRPEENPELLEKWRKAAIKSADDIEGLKRWDRRKPHVEKTEDCPLCKNLGIGCDRCKRIAKDLFEAV